MGVRYKPHESTVELNAEEIGVNIVVNFISTSFVFADACVLKRVLVFDKVPCYPKMMRPKLDETDFDLALLNILKNRNTHNISF